MNPLPFLLATVAALLLALGASKPAHAADTLLLPPPLATPLSLPPVGAGGGFQTFGALPLGEFLRITIGDIAHRPFILSPDAAASTQSISADFTAFKGKDILTPVSALLSGLGLSIREVGGILLIEKTAKPTTPPLKPTPATLVYRPLHNPVSAFSPYFAFFSDLQFAGSAAAAGPIQAPSSLGGSALSAPGSSSSSSGSPDGSGGASAPFVFTSAASSGSTLGLLVAQGPQPRLDQLKALLDKVDVATPEVLLRAFVFEVRESNSNESAVQLVLNLLGGRVSAQFGSALSADSMRLNLNNLQLAVSDITTDSRVRLVSSPVLRAASGSTATAKIGTDTPTLGSIVSSNGSTSQSVSYQTGGVVLTLSPQVFEDSIRLSVSQELSSFVKTDTGLTGTPTKLRRSFKSDVVAKSGEALLLGGLSEVQTTQATTANRWWFDSSAGQKQSSQIVVLIQVERI